jgi:hypothetical protein
MKKFIRLTMCVAMLVIAVLLADNSTAKEPKAKKMKREKPAEETTVSEMKLPEKVRATFVDRFPNAAINKLESEKKGGVTVWDIEFRDGRTRKETDIADDGTMLEYTVRVTKKTVPKQAMKRMEAAAKKEGAAIGTMERIEVSYETKDGKVVKLAKPATRYAMEMIKGEHVAEIVVDDKGKVVEEPKWEASKQKDTKSAA